MRLVRSRLLWWEHLPVGARRGRPVADAVRRRIPVNAPRARLVRAGVARTVGGACFVVVVAPALGDLAGVRVRVRMSAPCSIRCSR